MIDELEKTRTCARAIHSRVLTNCDSKLAERKAFILTNAHCASLFKIPKPGVLDDGKSPMHSSSSISKHKPTLKYRSKPLVHTSRPRAYRQSPVWASHPITSEVIASASQWGDIETVAGQYQLGECNDNANNHENHTTGMAASFLERDRRQDFWKRF